MNYIYIINCNWAHAWWQHKDHTSHENRTIHHMNFHSTIQYIYTSAIQAHEHYKTEDGME
jgi:hypothetical protein